MSPIQGYLYPPGSSRREAAELWLTGGAVSVRVAGRERVPPTPLGNLQITSRLGDTPRFFGFSDGSRFETTDNDAVDALLKSRQLHVGFIHRMESAWRWVVAGLVGVVLFAWGTIQYGVPALANAAAFAVPPEINRQIGDGVLEALDRQLFEPSGLDAATQARLRQRFQQLGALVEPDARTEVLFRDGGELIGPNAFALPSGKIVFTDRLVTLAENDEQLLAVFAHEMGHVVHRHGLRQSLQGSMLTLIAMAVVGDVSSVSSVIAGIPVLLTELGYSRDFEREADRYALQALTQARIAPHHFADILTRLEQTMRCDDGKPCPSDDDTNTSYLSTHPPTAERVRAMGS